MFSPFSLLKLVEWAREPHIVTVNRATPLDDWYHMDGPLVLAGHAAQPLAVSPDLLTFHKKLN